MSLSWTPFGLAKSQPVYEFQKSFVVGPRVVGRGVFLSTAKDSGNLNKLLGCLSDEKQSSL